MTYPTKIATCCYCGTRAALVLERGRHELSCTSCGAPLHEMKMLPTERPVPVMRHKPKAPPHPVARPAKVKKRKRRKSLWSRVFEDIVDVIEDVLD